MKVSLALAVLLPLPAFALQWVLWPWLSPLVWFLFYPTVFLSARIGGFKAGMLSTLLSVGIVWFFFMPLSLSGSLDTPSTLYSCGLFLLMGYLFSHTHERLRQVQRQLEARLLEARQISLSELQHYEQIVATSSDMLAFVDKGQRYQVVNPAYASLFAATPASLQQRCVADVLEAKHYASISPYLDLALAGEAQRFTTEALCFDGKLRILDGEYRPYRQHGEIQGVVVNLRDVTGLKQAEAALKDREFKLAAIVNHSPSVLSLKYPDGRYALANPSLQRLHHLTEEQIIGKTDVDLYAEATAFQFKANDELVLRTLAGHSIEENIDVEGRQLSFMSHIFPILDASGAAQFIGRISLDITGSKQAEKAIRDSKLQLEAALSSIADAVFMSDAEGRFVEFNDAFAAFHRFKGKSECVTTFAEYAAILDVYMVDGSPAPLEEWPVSRALRGETVINAEYVLRRKDTGEIWVGIHSFAPIRNADGVIVGSVVTARDITERKRTEQLLRESEAKLRNVFANAAIGFAIMAPDGRFVDANSAYCKIVGFNIDALREHSFQQLIHPDDVAANMVLIQQLLAKQINDFVIENRYFRPDGAVVWVRKSISIVRHSNGEPQWLIALVEDISERKHAEDEIRQLTSDLESRVIERTAELSSANNELNSFAYAVSHDLRAPLRAICGFSQALQEDYGEQLPDQAKLYLDQINIASTKMSALIDGLLVLSRSTRGELQRDMIDLSALAGNLLDELKKNDPERLVAVQVEAGLQGVGDARMIEVVMRNLLENAWKYTGHTPAASIRVYAEEQDGKAYCCVADNGAGFDMAHANRLFLAFQRLHRQDEFPGIGIGLATVQRIIHRHGGAIEARGEIGKGAVFCFTLGATGTGGD